MKEMVKKVAKAEVMKHEKSMHKGKKMANGGMAMMKYADGGKVMKYADGGMVGCGHRGAQDYGKKK